MSLTPHSLNLVRRRSVPEEHPHTPLPVGDLLLNPRGRAVVEEVGGVVEDESGDALYGAGLAVMDRAVMGVVTLAILKRRIYHVLHAEVPFTHQLGGRLPQQD